VFDGKIHITSFGEEEVRCLSMLVMTITHFTSDGKHDETPPSLPGFCDLPVKDLKKPKSN
jgi:hypothetical protein